ncbi:MAG TPA: hypothetical protein VMV92_27295 [Streptosporangiaceae bacterium]|nr:hypothetical protein [Streptosporangiaceae bacterium]
MVSMCAWAAIAAAFNADGGDGGDDDDGQHDRDSQRGAPVGHPVHLLLAAVPEYLRAGAAAAGAEHDLRAVPGCFLQLRQRQRHGAPGMPAARRAG